MRSINENRKLCERYPYLIPRNSWTGAIPDDYNYEYIEGDYDLEEGWIPLFLQMCEDIRQPLIDANFLNEFRFAQLKEKYGEMRCYNFGAPREVQDIISKYEYVSNFICEKCGKPAKYQTSGWIGEYCEDCIKEIIKPEYIDECEKIEFDPIMRITRFSKDGETKEEVDCSDIWRRLYD